MHLYLCFICSSFESHFSELAIELLSESPVFVELLQLLDAVARMASLGFEKSYREAVVLMTRCYLSKLAAVGSAESKTAAPEATTERVEVHA